MFYEEVTNPKVLEAMIALHSMHKVTSLPVKFSIDSPEPCRKIVTKQGSFDKDHDKLYISKCIALITSLPFVK